MVLVVLVAAVVQAVKARLHRLAGETVSTAHGRAIVATHKVRAVAPAITIFSTTPTITPVVTAHTFGTGELAQAPSSEMVLATNTSLAATDTPEAASGHNLAAVRGATSNTTASHESHM